jgi:hypothetical protein
MKNTKSKSVQPLDNKLEKSHVGDLALIASWVICNQRLVGALRGCGSGDASPLSNTPLQSPAFLMALVLRFQLMFFQLSAL